MYLYPYVFVSQKSFLQKRLINRRTPSVPLFRFITYVTRSDWEANGWFSSEFDLVTSRRSLISQFQPKIKIYPLKHQLAASLAAKFRAVVIHRRQITSVDVLFILVVTAIIHITIVPRHGFRRQSKATRLLITAFQDSADMLTRSISQSAARKLEI